MSRFDLLGAIEENTHPLEDARDLETMIRMIADRRCEYRGSEPDDSHLEFGGKIICVIFEGAKSKKYQREALAYRLLMYGIHEDDALRNAFNASMTNELVVVEEAHVAIELGFSRLLRPIHWQEQEASSGFVIKPALE